MLKTKTGTTKPEIELTFQYCSSWALSPKADSIEASKNSSETIAEMKDRIFALFNKGELNFLYLIKPMIEIVNVTKINRAEEIITIVSPV